jgi:chromate transport protein ChrA
MFFGCLSAGRIGGVVAGLAFILPGFLLMLLASYLYSLAGLENAYFNASFRAVQPIVAAMVCLLHAFFFSPGLFFSRNCGM